MDHREAIVALRQFLSTQILGQERLIERLLIALLADGHLLVEGAPGLAKTRQSKSLQAASRRNFIASSSHPTYCQLTLPELKSTDRKPAASSFNKAPSFTIWCWQMR